MSEIVVSTSRMREVRAIDTVNDTITVEAGVVLKEIQNAADRADRLFPLSLGAEGSCQIGGNISTNAGGVQVLRYGNMRNLVLGLEVVLPDGSVWDGLRGLRKDNTGYDMKQVFAGAEGTLGIITAAVLRLFPKPTASETAWIGVDAPTAAVALLGHVRPSRRHGLGVDLIGRPIIDLLLSGVPGHEDPMQDIHPWYVLMDVTSQGPPGSLHTPLADALGAALETGLVVDALIAASGAQAANSGRCARAWSRPRQRQGVASPTTCQSRCPAFRNSSSAPMPPLRLRVPASAAAPSATSATATCTTTPSSPSTWTGQRFARNARASIASCTTSSPA